MKTIDFHQSTRESNLAICWKEPLQIIPYTIEIKVLFAVNKPF